MESILDRCKRNILFQIYHARSGHPGGSLSCLDLLLQIYQRHSSNGFDSFQLILSKGHAVPAWYAVATEYGLLDRSELRSFRRLNSLLQGHPSVTSLSWVGASTGSLGQGFSVAMGIALGCELQGIDKRVYALLGDGEMQEGQVWEVAMAGAHYKLSNLCAIVDYNKLQSDDLNENVLSLGDLAAKWAAFNWHVLEIDGHSSAEITRALDLSKANTKGPTVIIANTLKGKGISFMEGVPSWHGSVTIRQDEFKQALLELHTPLSEVPRYLDGSIWELAQ